MVSSKSMVFNTMTHRLMLCYYKKAKKRSILLQRSQALRAVESGPRLGLEVARAARVQNGKIDA